MRLAIIKNDKRKSNHIENEVIDILPESHIFSELDLLICDSLDIEDVKVESVNKEIENYYMTAKAIGSTPAAVKKYYDGELKWQTV